MVSVCFAFLSFLVCLIFCLLAFLRVSVCVWPGTSLWGYPFLDLGFESVCVCLYVSVCMRFSINASEPIFQLKRAWTVIINETPPKLKVSCRDTLCVFYKKRINEERSIAIVHDRPWQIEALHRCLPQLTTAYQVRTASFPLTSWCRILSDLLKFLKALFLPAGVEPTQLHGPSNSSRSSRTSLWGLPVTRPAWTIGPIDEQFER